MEMRVQQSGVKNRSCDFRISVTIVISTSSRQEHPSRKRGLSSSIHFIEKLLAKSLGTGVFFIGAS
jgi:hypothetical protein